MKIWIILLSMAAAAGTWWWHARYKYSGGQTLRQKLKIVTTSLAAGVAVYFSLMAIAFIYLVIVSK